MTHTLHVVHSTGWGGARNIYPGDGMLCESFFHFILFLISFFAPHHRSSSPSFSFISHLTSLPSHLPTFRRCGFANHSSAEEPAVEHHSVEHGKYESMGRVEVGNIVHDTGKERVD
ncbi:hypothetical protein BDN70DRAFT_887151 [Pholiota conissans]|uniref:Uncharacterized protein n=1 Tax=Pholiota conissans TaxID=109636 RepID=A0A9P6CTP3_9AGAR|nr:hypothetical protein BDN70DRAFT_887151 [Pholiota conissans]